MKTINTTKNSKFEIIGIITNQKDYTLAWYLNKILELNFSKIKNNFINNNFSLYMPDNNNSLILIENKNSTGIYLAEMKKFNFILKVSDNTYFNNFIKPKLKTTNNYIFTGIIDQSRLTKKTKKIISEIQF